MANKVGRPSVKNENKTDVIETKVTEEIKIDKVENQPKIKQQRDLNELVSVKNNLHRKLVYPSKIYAGNEYEWGQFGEENYLELRDLVAMRNSYPTYFRECWVMLDDDILEYLGVKKYYEKALDMENFDDIFTMNIKDLKVLLEELPTSMKTSVAQRARQLIDNGTIDSMKVIKVLNETLHVDLVL